MFNRLPKLKSSEIEHSPKAAVKPVQNGFDNLGITDKIIKVIADLNFVDPTPVQKQAIPICIKGRDIIAIAQTGTGKTLAFGVPMVMRLHQNKDEQGLIIAPTRELALQIDEALQPLCRAYQMRTVVIMGGVAIEPQCRALAKKPAIIIATPGRLIDHLDRRSINLAEVKILVLDEADRMLDMGFAPAIARIILSIPTERQTMLFSATMPNEIMTLARKYMNNPSFIEVAPSGASPDEITHEIFYVDNADKTRLLENQLLKCKGPVLIFTRTKHGARKLTVRIREMGYSVAEIHANRSLGQRSAALEGFKKGRYSVLVATDIAARGIDVKGIALVINYDLPSTSEGYVHRIGRTGRAGRDGHATSFATFDQEKEIRDIEDFVGVTLAVSALPFAPSGRFAKFQDRSGPRCHSKARLKSQVPQPSKPAAHPNRTFGRRRVNEKRVAK